LSAQLAALAAFHCPPPEYSAMNLRLSLRRSPLTRSAARAGKSHIRTETAIQWAGVARATATRAQRPGAMRFRRRIRVRERPTARPYIFSVDNVKRLLEAASGLDPRNLFRGLTYGTFFALLACTGLRVSEAIKLRFEDFTAQPRSWQPALLRSVGPGASIPGTRVNAVPRAKYSCLRSFQGKWNSGSTACPVSLWSSWRL
jgi:integrase